MSEIESRLRVILKEQLGLVDSELTSGALLVDDCGCDSLDMVELLIDVECEFDIQISDESAEAVKTVGDAIRLVEALVAGASR